MYNPCDKCSANIDECEMCEMQINVENDISSIVKVLGYEEFLNEIGICKVLEYFRLEICE